MALHMIAHLRDPCAHVVQFRAIDCKRNHCDPAGRLAWALLKGRGMAADAATLLRVRILVLANVALQLADGYVTLLGTSRGFSEGNPIVAAAMTSMGPTSGLWLVKLLAIGILAWLYRHGPHPLVAPGLLSVAISYTIFAVLPWAMLLVGTPPG